MARVEWKRYWTQVSQLPSEECWPWPGILDKLGYGRIGGKLAYRRAYESVHGPVPEGLELDHLCQNPICVNPSHLEAVTHRENVRRGNGWAGRHARQTHCKNGHEFTPENTYRGQDGKRRTCRRCQNASVRQYTARKKAVA